MAEIDKDFMDTYHSRMIAEKAVEEIVDKIVGKDYQAGSLVRQVQDKVIDIMAKRLAEEFYNQHKLDIINAMDIKSIAQVVTFQMITHLKRDLG